MPCNLPQSAGERGPRHTATAPAVLFRRGVCLWLLADEPASALDPVATERIEELLLSLKQDYTILLVTHNIQQAARVADRTAFFLLGDLIEYGPTNDLFTKPKDSRTDAFISGRFG